MRHPNTITTSYGTFELMVDMGNTKYYIIDQHTSPLSDHKFFLTDILLYLPNGKRDYDRAIFEEDLSLILSDNN